MRRLIATLIWKKHRATYLCLKGLANHPLRDDQRFLDLFGAIRAERRALLSLRELHNIYRLVQQARGIDGDLAEVGVYRGGSARVICEAKADKTLHLFDTFKGMPEVNEAIDRHRRGDFDDTSLGAVQTYLAGFGEVRFYPGLFPESAADLAGSPTRFSFVNLDVDLYESTLSGLAFFYPRLSRNGFLLSHDYRAITCPGVKRAFDEFFADKPEPVIDLWDSQALVIKQ